ncbi:MAG: hypothetical protein LCH76_12150 [Actinobacteria bacterium]|nr:hypothetical protein [Actinomycetota bacterium]
MPVSPRVHPLKRLAAVALAVVLAFTLHSSAALAKRPKGPSSLTDATTAIDAHLGYQKQKTCTPTAKPGAKALLKLLIKTWGGSSSGISRSCTIGGTSEHKEGRALDWHMNVSKPKQKKAVADALRWLTDNDGEVAYRLGIMYIIWDQKIWSVYYQELGWRKMENRGSRTANHKDHVHISLSWDGAMQQTSWWTGRPVTQPLNQACGVKGARACLPVVKRAASTWKSKKVKVPAFLPAPWKIPGIGGSPQVGRTLTVVPGTWVPAQATLTYQWLADRKRIPGATAATYVVTSSVIGKEISVRVTATKPDGTVVAKKSDPTTEVLRGAFTKAPKPRIVGDRVTGATLSVDTKTWNPVPTSFSYRWYRNSKAIKGATKPTYQLTRADLGKKITVKVKARASGFSKTVTSAKTKKVVKGKLPLAPVPVVTGQPVRGQTLLAAPGSWGPAPVKLSYQWYRDGVAIKGATSRSYTLTTADVGHVVRVRVSGKKSGYLTTRVRSVSGPKVTRTAPSPTPTPSPTPKPTPSPTPKPTPTPTPTPTTTSPEPGPSTPPPATDTPDPPVDDAP